MTKRHGTWPGRLKKRDVGYYLAVLLMVAIAAWPFLVRGGLPRETDAELHVFRLAELARLVAGGEFYPRWAPNFYFGYGYPIFNYYAPLAYYLGLPVVLLPGFDAVAGVKFVFVLTFLIGAVGLYGFVSDWWSRRAGLVSVAAYVFAPYVQYVDPHARGDLAEFLSFGVFPLALWAYGRLVRGPTPLRFLSAVLTTALIILAHNLMAMVFFAFLCFGAAWQVAALWRHQQRDSQTVSGWPTSAAFLVGMIAPLLLGVGLAAFFWLPVALEQNAVNLSNLVGEGGHFDFRNHFLSLGEMLGRTSWLDWGATEPDFSLNLGIGQWLLALLGVAGVATGFARQRAHALQFVIAAIGLLFLMTAPSVLIWQLVPMMPFLQFPWRLLGPCAIVLAVLAGVGVDAVVRALAGDRPNALPGEMNHKRLPAMGRVSVFTSLARWFPAFAILVLSLQALPLTMTPPWTEGAWDTSAPGVMAIERQGRWLGTTSTADFVPRTVEVLPRPQDEMLEQFLAGSPLDRVNRATLPDGATVEAQRLTPLHTRYTVTSDAPFLLRLFQFDFPGWQARIDGQMVQTDLGRPEGFLIIPVPQGNHVVDIEFVETPARRAAWLTSAVALIATIALVVASSRAGWMPPSTAEAAQGSNDGKGQKTVLRTVAIALVLVVAAFFATQSLGLFHHQSAGWQAVPASNNVFYNAGDQAVLIGFDAPDMAEGGDTIDVTLYWKAKEDLAINYQVFLHLLDADGLPVAQSDKLNPGDFPTSRWPADKYVRDTHRLTIPTSLAPGTYALSTGLWVQTEGWRLPLLNRDGDQIDDSIQFAEITIR